MTTADNDTSPSGHAVVVARFDSNVQGVRYFIGGAQIPLPNYVCHTHVTHFIKRQ